MSRPPPVLILICQAETHMPPKFALGPIYCRYEGRKRTHRLEANEMLERYWVDLLRTHPREVAP